jgi:antitoxin MazE
MKAKIISIGNSRGIRIPKQLLEMTNLGDEVELEAERDRIVIRSARQPRQGWDDAFKAMAAEGDDRLLDPPLSTKFDEEEWDW